LKKIFKSLADLDGQNVSTVRLIENPPLFIEEFSHNTEKFICFVNDSKPLTSIFEFSK